MNDPLVSVILPTYNRAYCLSRAVDSVLAQSHRNLELIVVDDGSTDGTQALLAAFSDPRLRVLTPGRLGSAARARNVGIGAARGEFIAFQDSDDVWLIDKLSRQLACVNDHPHAAVIFCGYLVVVPSGTRAEYRGANLLKRQSDFTQIMTFGYDISTPAWLVRRTALEQVGTFSDDLKTWEDWELSIRLDQAGGFAVVDEPLMISFETPGSVKWNFDAYAQTLDAIMQRHPEALTRNTRVIARHRWLQTLWELRMGRAANARKYLLKAFATNPTYWKLWPGTLHRSLQLFAGARWE